MMSRSLHVLPLLAVTLLFAGRADADRRSFVWTYEYQTMEKGEAEIEHYMTLTTPDAGKVEGTVTTEHQLELEIGMTERYDFSIYQVFKQKPGASLAYAGYKLRSRYRLGKRGGDLLRPILYLEYKGVSDFSEHEIDLKPIVGRTFEQWTVALNPVLEFARAAEEGEWEFEPGYAAAAGRRFNPHFGLGLEVAGSEKGHYIGPVLAHGRENLWIALGSGLKVGRVKAGEPELKLRLLIGFGVAARER